MNYRVTVSCEKLNSTSRRIKIPLDGFSGNLSVSESSVDDTASFLDRFENSFECLVGYQDG